MDKADRTRLETRLSRHYAAQRDTRRQSTTPQTMDNLVTMMLAEDARMAKVRFRSLGHAAFVAAQVSYISAWTWALQASLVVLMVLMAHISTSSEATKAVIGALSAATVLVGAPTIQASKQYGVAELEYSCPNNTASVMVARLIILGCSSSLAVAVMIGAVASSLDASVFSVALWTCPPFFCSCAGSLAILRKATPATATTLCAAWIITCSSALAAAASFTPHLYDSASLAVWAAAAAVALVWLVREVIMTFRSVAAGLDAFSPQLAQTYN